MNIEELRQYCIDKKEVTESFPFDETTLVFKVVSKMFLLTDVESELAMVIRPKGFRPMLAEPREPPPA